MWDNQLADVPVAIKMGLQTTGSLPAESYQPWLCWRSLNRVLTGTDRAKTTMRRWGFIDNAQSVNCDCGAPHTMGHLLCWRLLDEPCSPQSTASLSQTGQRRSLRSSIILCEGPERRRWRRRRSRRRRKKKKTEKKKRKKKKTKKKTTKKKTKKKKKKMMRRKKKTTKKKTKKKKKKMMMRRKKKKRSVACQNKKNRQYQRHLEIRVTKRWMHRI